MTQAAVTDQMDALIARYPGLFFVQGSTSSFAQSAANVMKKLKDEGKIGNRVAIVNVADAFGIELANAGRPIFKQAGFDIVYDKSYPNTAQDFAPVIKAVKAENPDAFVAWSYPSDTFGLAEQAKIEGLNVKAYYSAVGVAFPTFRGKFGASAENVLGAGGIQDNPDIRGYYERHKKVTGVDADHWGSLLYYTFLQILEQAMEGVGEVDRAKITAYLKSHVQDHHRRSRHPQPEAQPILDRGAVAGRLLPRRRRRRLRGLQAGEAQDRLVSAREQWPGAVRSDARAGFSPIGHGVRNERPHRRPAARRHLRADRDGAAAAIRRRPRHELGLRRGDRRRGLRHVLVLRRRAGDPFLVDHRRRAGGLRGELGGLPGS